MATALSIELRAAGGQARGGPVAGLFPGQGSQTAGMREAVAETAPALLPRAGARRRDPADGLRPHAAHDRARRRPADANDPSPVADACCFLLSPLARAITGEVLHVDGGYHAMGAPRQPQA